MGLLTTNKVRFPAKAVKDTLLYCIPEFVFNDLCERYEVFADFVEVEDAAHLKRAVQSKSDDANALTTSTVKTVLTREPPWQMLIIPSNHYLQMIRKLIPFLG